MKRNGKTIIIVAFLLVFIISILLIYNKSKPMVNVVEKNYENNTLTYNGYLYNSFVELKSANTVLNETELFSLKYSISQDLVKMKSVVDFSSLNGFNDKTQYKINSHYYISKYDNYYNPVCIVWSLNSVGSEDNDIYYLRDDFAFEDLPNLNNTNVISIQVETYGVDNPKVIVLEDSVKDDIIRAMKEKNTEDLIRLLPKNDTVAYIEIRYQNSPFVQHFGNYYEKTLNYID